METKSTSKTNRKIGTSEFITPANIAPYISTIVPVWTDGDETTGSLSGNYYTFTGRRSDPESELMYYRRRYYSPNLGRFVRRERRFGSPANRYSYCDDSPVTWFDPYGLQRAGITGTNEAPWLSPYGEDLVPFFHEGGVMWLYCPSPPSTPPEFPYLSSDAIFGELSDTESQECEKLKNQAITNPLVSSLLKKIDKNPGCKRPTLACKCCPKGARAAFVRSKNMLVLCGNVERGPFAATGAALDLVHELTHALQWCQNKNPRDCLQALKDEVQAYKAEGKSLSEAIEGAVASSCMGGTCKKDDLLLRGKELLREAVGYYLEGPSPWE